MIWSLLRAATCAIVASFKSRAGMPFPEISDTFLGNIDQRALSLWNCIGDGIVARSCPPSRDQVHFGLRLCAFRDGAGEYRCKEWAAGNILNGRAAEQNLAQVRFGLRQLLRFLVRERFDDDIADAGVRIHGRWEPCAERFEALIARADQDLPVAEVRVAMYGIYKINNDALLIRAEHDRYRR